MGRFLRNNTCWNEQYKGVHLYDYISIKAKWKAFIILFRSGYHITKVTTKKD